MIRCMRCDSILEVKILPSGEYMEPCPNCIRGLEKSEDNVSKAYDSGYDEGYSDGNDIGYDEGYSAGVNWGLENDEEELD